MTTFNPITISCFKAYDVRGELDVNLDNAIAYRIGRAFAQYLNDGKENPVIVVGSDIRPSSESLKQSAIDGIADAGVDVIDLGMVGTEEVYFATSHYNAIGGIEVTASHNPINYNGLKMVRENSRPISGDTGLADIRAIAERGEFVVADKGKVTLNTDKTAYIDKLMSFTDTAKFTPKKIVVNSGNGSAGPVVDELEKRLGDKIELIKVHHTPDSSFPNGIPNPMIIANQKTTSDAVIAHGADFGVAFDGDFDRCFLFDEKGRFIEGSYIVGMLAEVFLKKHQGESIVYDPRVIYNTENVIAQNGGKPAISKSGHSFIKQVMRETGAIYGGEMSAHHYFRDFAYCDSGMIVWLLVIELLSVTGKTLSELVNGYINDFPSSGELNFRLGQKTATEIGELLEQKYHALNPTKNTLDGLSLDFGNWRFNLRSSNTEPLIRLNIETKGDKELLKERTDEILAVLDECGAVSANH
ncbi:MULTISPECIES: phosphomannomutase/phosphoglucomutase [Moraxella]|uniref:phosphomannomutase n=1 Tax=Moraxella lacunata TaxID=477 RepID=A0A1B8PXS8_MORLA|nr:MULTISPECIES: phosphomannomutase/phosphoglucomutase [Moraxella]MBE9579937.1 phosphomannomutase/phosphoglucomutase [Moraxella sp. K1664]MBE9589051.1 phosphomannomutase/phosphoglucomutase [Moraxella sp. K1630]MBE9590980.1 phosphomannomutase/phosphoglucomutase [Moraxella sp. K127]MBE9597294.1 phosphomannomutase/phosphoglucomutase [Moraxella sp. K2450]MDH9219821.1 phosphomannomutase/phosphoglucomutase [Moraxella lacunata]